MTYLYIVIDPIVIVEGFLYYIIVHHQYLLLDKGGMEWHYMLITPIGHHAGALHVVFVLVHDKICFLFSFLDEFRYNF